MCGGDLEVAEGVTIAECEYCGTNQTVPKAMDENLQNLFNRANTLRIKSEFDKAEKLYEKIIQADTTQSEAYWGLILCKYGIEYVDDPVTYKKIPTCHRASYDSIIADDDYKSAIENADMSQRVLYEEQAKEIDRIQKEILALAQKEETYDVFICYKETDADGKRTQDSVIANDIYYQLTQEGFKVFYAAITLEGKLGSAYEPIIFAALNSAKVMLSIGTKPEHFNAVWVKNEWSRFLKIIKKDRSKLLIPCYRDMDAYELPEEFAHLQAQDMTKIGFINDLVRGIKKVITKDETKETVTVKETVVTASSANTAPLLKRAFMFLEDGDWSSADEYCEKVLDIDPENAQAYVGKLMAGLRVKKQDNLKDCAETFENNNNYQKALRFADDSLKTELMGYIDHIKIRNENKRFESIYTQATNTLGKATTESACRNASELFASIKGYKDADVLSKQCFEKAEELRKNDILNTAKFKMSSDVITNQEYSLRLFESISGWKDADELAEACRQRIIELKEEKLRQDEEERIKREQRRIEGERLLEERRKKRERKRKRNKKIAIIVIPIICIIIALNTVIIPNSKYNDAIALMDAGKYTDAISAFEALEGYKDSVNKIEECNVNIYGEEVWNKVKSVNIGDTYRFGSYEKDNNKSNGQEDIEWLVLAKEGTKILVISKEALDCKPYNTSYTDVTWETCTLRKWLNNDFLDSAFSANEKTMIPTVTVSADKNPDYSTNPGNTTQDQVFLLSITEVNKYFNSDRARQCKPTDYAVANGAWERDSGNCYWWLRSPGYSQYDAAAVNIYGDVDEFGYAVNYDRGAVRPALWIDLSQI